MESLSPEQRAILDEGIAQLRKRLERRKAVMALPSLKRRADALERLRAAVLSVKKAAASKSLQKANLPAVRNHAPVAERDKEPPEGQEYWARDAILNNDPREKAAASEPQRIADFSAQTSLWLAEALAVADELRTLAKPPRNPVLKRGFRRPNEYRAWLIGEEIPALYARLFDGARLPLTVEAKGAKGKRGMEFVRHVLDALGEANATDNTIKVLVSAARRRVRASATRAKL